MKLLIVLSALVALTVSQGSGYTTVNDNVDLDAVINNPELLKAWFNCFVDKGPCGTVEGTFKADLPEAIQQACAKCNPTQKGLMKKFLEGLKQKAPADFEVFKNKFDPENKYFQHLAKAFA